MGAENRIKINDKKVEYYYSRLFDPNWDISENFFEAVTIATQCNVSGCIPKSKFYTRFSEMTLFRLRKDYPHVFAITIGQFYYFRSLEEYWDTHGFIDPNGFRWLRQSIKYGSG